MGSKERFILKMEDARISLYALGRDLERGVIDDTG